MARRTNYSNEEKLRYIEEYEQSGMSKKGFAESKGLSHINFYRWFKRFRGGNEEVSAFEGRQEFVPVQVIERGNEAGKQLELTFPEHISLKFPVGTDINYLFGIIRAIRA